jgi:uncharacterized protein YbaA (DUF1428 family)
MSTYVDGFLFPIAKANLDRYREMAELAGQVWIEHGALAYWECLGDDLDNPEMTTQFPALAGAGPDETVGFSWIVFKSKEDRDEINAKVMADPRMNAMCNEDDPNPPLDFKRMAYGGFKPLVQK